MKIGNLWKKLLGLALLLCIVLIISGCSSSDEKPQISFEEASVSPSSFTRDDFHGFIISWRISYKHVTQYRLSLYLSADAHLDNNDTLLFQANYSSPEGQVVLDQSSPGFDLVNAAAANRYFLILKAEACDAQGDLIYLYDQSPLTSLYYLSFTKRAPVAKWTVMVYMAGDNSLSSESSLDLNELVRVGSSQDVRLVVLCDQAWSPARIYYVREGELVKLQDLGEISMADPQNLVNFADFVFDVYPAEHYLLILWDHGRGFEPPRRDLLQDEDPTEKWMDVPTLGEALRTIKSHLSRPLDIVGFDACLMGMLEVAYEIRDTASYMVASENYEWGPGWDYQLALEPLLEHPETSPVDLAQGLVSAFAEEYAEDEDSTLAAVDLTQILSVRQALDALVLALENSAQNDPTVYDLLTGIVFDQVQRFDDGVVWGISADDDSFVDLYHLISLIKSAINIPAVQTEAQLVLDALQQAVLSSWYSSASVANAHGLSIWYPNPNLYVGGEWEYLWTHYQDLAFAKDSKWGGFLLDLWGINP